MHVSIVSAIEPSTVISQPFSFRRHQHFYVFSLSLSISYAFSVCLSFFLCYRRVFDAVVIVAPLFAISPRSFTPLSIPKR